ncbi:MAG: YybS family protein [Treponema sp.]|jgi:hypothetical protein|nr:YybS family protein [Treponema sp.]
MFQEGERFAEETAKPAPLLAVSICAGISVFMTNTGFLSFLFLAPLGYAALVYNSAWLAGIIVVIINSVFLLAGRLFFRGDAGIIKDILYLAVMSFSFVWIMNTAKSRIRTVYRFVLASCAGALSFMFFIMGGDDSALNMMIRTQAEALSSLLISSGAAQSSVMQMLSVDRIIELIKNISLRGGALVSAFFLFFVNRHVAVVMARIIKKQSHYRPLTAFFAPERTVWIMSAALAAVMLTKLIRMQFFEILAWNVLVVCGILYLAQGAGIVMFFLARRTPAFRLGVNILIIIMIFSPGINIIGVAALMLLGIAENWLPLRAPKQDGSASTPEL